MPLFSFSKKQWFTLSSIFSIPINNNNIDQHLKFAYIPFFTYDMPQYKFIPPLDCTAIMVLGNMAQNKWIVVKNPTNSSLRMSQFSCHFNKIFHIY